MTHKNVSGTHKRLKKEGVGVFCLLVCPTYVGKILVYVCFSQYI